MLGRTQKPPQPRFMNTRWNFLSGIALCAAVCATTHAAEPVLGKSPRYCNPLPMINSAGASASGDVTVIRENGKYYMYCTGGGAWISDDMLNWSFQRVAGVPVAPHVVKFNGAFYLCGNDGPLFKADNPLGPFTSVGEWTQHAQRGRRLERRFRRGPLRRLTTISPTSTTPAGASAASML